MKKTVLTAIALTCAVSVFAQGTVNFNNRNGYTTHVYGGPGVGTQVQGPAAADNYNGAAGVRPNVPYAPQVLIGTTGGPISSNIYASLLGRSLAGAGNAFAAGALGSALGGGTVTTFRTGAAAGNIVGATATFNNIPKDADGTLASFMMVAWDSQNGAITTWAQALPLWIAGTIAAGTSDVFQFNTAIGGDSNTPPGWGAINAPQAGSFNIYIVPEPTTIALAGLGAAALVIFRRRKQ